MFGDRKARRAKFYLSEIKDKSSKIIFISPKIGKKNGKSCPYRTAFGGLEWLMLFIDVSHFAEFLLILLF
jgi:hypothetical protein